ncbi:hypothetical protein [Hyalangium gracile]|uniref:hypothetical protein n=1 Tax=Hyalangium gracile TaxID=394092 RepID=UPI001CCB309B|nr:hypothetical protein [Hyalangium gracile]
MDVKLLGIYLNDHLSGARAGIDLARRAARENQGNPLGDFLATLSAELEQDRALVEQVLRTLKVPRDTLKQSVAWVGEKVARLKLNGRLVRYSPLSRFEELEALFLGTQGRRAMWRMLRRLARTERQLAGFDFEVLVARTEMQLRNLERWRLQAADTAFTHAPFISTSLFPAENAGQ